MISRFFSEWMSSVKASAIKGKKNLAFDDAKFA